MALHPFLAEFLHNVEEQGILLSGFQLPGGDGVLVPAAELRCALEQELGRY